MSTIVVNEAKLVLPTLQMPSFIQIEQDKQDKKAAEALVVKTDKKEDGFKGLIPKAFLMEANTTDEEQKMTSSSSIFGKYLANVAMKAALESALAKAVSSATCWGQLNAIFGSGNSPWNNSSDAAVASTAQALTNYDNSKTENSDTDNDQNINSQHQQNFFSMTQLGSIISNQAQVNKTVSDNLGKMASDMQGDGETLSSVIGNLAIHAV